MFSEIGLKICKQPPTAVIPPVLTPEQYSSQRTKKKKIAGCMRFPKPAKMWVWNKVSKYFIFIYNVVRISKLRYFLMWLHIFKQRRISYNIYISSNISMSSYYVLSTDLSRVATTGLDCQFQLASEVSLCTLAQLQHISLVMRNTEVSRRRQKQ